MLFSMRQRYDFVIVGSARGKELSLVVVAFEKISPYFIVLVRSQFSYNHFKIRTMKKTLLLLAAFFAFAITTQAQIQNYNVGDVVPDFTVTDTDNNTWSLHDRTAMGQYVLLDFFFTTCPPCQQTQKYFNEMHDKYGCNNGDVFCISIDIGDNNAQVIAFENTYGGTFTHSPAVSGTEGGGDAVNATFNPTAYPTYCLIGPDNKMINLDIWPISSVASYEAAFPANSITPMSCSAVAVDPAVDAVSMNIYPNPASTSAKVDLYFDQAGEASIEIYNLIGARVHAQSLGSVNQGDFRTELNLNELEMGSYFVKVIRDGQAMGTKKLTVIR
jgi:thiol-disulfide isomerase/thioredoxin